MRNWRLKRGWRLEELARAAGLSMGAVSRIENGTVSTSLTTLRALSWALGVPISSLLRRSEQQYEAVFKKAGQPIGLRNCPTPAETLGDIEVLSSGIKVEPYLVRLIEQEAHFPTFRHSGMKFLYMLEGAIRYSHGEDHYDLGPGDSLLFEASVLHGPRKLLRGPALYLSIISARP
ncbi:helix-turn-helix domain-containing protein [Borborobacter arsenicus]|uniref:helix-turn-helix domain-containing protein n=1 Tax=Borborobacter arsenicus TaxID=1851146 RepID=UPI0014055CFE|nr:XRE family transcriptional regulator [Pseudaminobacter arsenicus]